MIEEIRSDVEMKYEEPEMQVFVMEESDVITDSTVTPTPDPGDSGTSNW